MFALSLHLEGNIYEYSQSMPSGFSSFSSHLIWPMGCSVLLSKFQIFRIFTPPFLSFVSQSITGGLILFIFQGVFLSSANKCLGMAF